MKPLKQLFEELGFNPDAPIQTQKAFLKHLNTAAQASAPIPIVKSETKENAAINTPSQKASECQTQNIIMQQLEFDFSNSKRVS